MDKITVDFKFKIGELVIPAKLPKSRLPGEMKSRGMVTSQFMERCEGGIQKFYMVRWQATNSIGEWGVADKLYRMAEIEVAPLPKE